MKTTLEKIKQRDFTRNNPIDTIGIIASGNYEYIVLLDMGDFTPMEAISYLATATRMVDRFACSELEQGILFIY